MEKTLLAISTIKINTLDTENAVDFKDPYELSFGLGLNLMNGYFFQEHFSSSTYLNADVLTPIELFKSNKLLNSKIGGGIHMYNFKMNDDNEQVIKATECSVFSFLGTINKKISNINLKFGAGFSLASVKTNNEEVSKTGITIAGNISYTLPIKIKNIKLKLHAGGMSSLGGENDIWNYKVFTGFYEMINFGLTGTYILL